MLSILQFLLANVMCCFVELCVVAFCCGCDLLRVVVVVVVIRVVAVGCQIVRFWYPNCFCNSGRTLLFDELL